MNNIEKGAVGTHIKEIRKNQSMTQDEFSKVLGVSKSFIAQLERGYRKPSLKVLKRISEEYGMSIEDILEGKCKVNISRDETAKEKNLQKYQTLAEVYPPDEMAKALVIAKTYLKMEG